MLAGLKRKLVAGAAVVTLGLAPVAAGAESLTDAMISAYKHSGLLNQQRALLRATDEDVAVAVSALRPVVNYAISAGYSDPTTVVANDDNFSASATLSANMMLYDFGRTQLGIDIAKETVLATRDALISVEQGVLLRAVQAFLNVRSALENAALQSNSVRVITQELRAANDRFEVGEVTQTDVSLAQARLAAVRAAEGAAQGQVAIAREEYRAATGHYPGRLSSPPAPPVTVRTLDQAKALARRTHPDMLRAQREVTIADLAVQMSLAGMKPSLNANSSVTFSTGGQLGTESRNTQLGVTLGGPIYQGGKLSALYRQAKARAEASRANLHIVRHSVDQNVGNAWAQLAIAAAQIEATDRQIRATRVALRGAREEASLGARTTLDVLNAEQELLDAEASRITAQSDQYQAVYALLGSMGLLTAEHLRLGIATYDPAAYYNTVSTAPVREVSPQGEKLDAVLEALGRK
ncbi:TolC family outer membrane protein [Aliiroseovarius subalbicans]|uniref:TolC family outer membrane protein n=1 Tax=Aliiroseovarius subalbicans TaxID=2925840 RepID=UPI001F59DBE9|nr:TolC family outer membrane protein [Aliiroseovarius subalbicans]MCI2399058.1 TolC family outer membrane protein [Aliiroseovarius subalbicans]